METEIDDCPIIKATEVPGETSNKGPSDQRSQRFVISAKAHAGVFRGQSEFPPPPVPEGQWNLSGMQTHLEWL